MGQGVPGVKGVFSVRLRPKSYARLPRYPTSSIKLGLKLCCKSKLHWSTRGVFHIGLKRLRGDNATT